MATARMRLCAVNVPCLIDSLEARDSMFLVELRTLRKISHAVEIFQLEEIRSAFGPGSHYLRGYDLHEAAARQILPEVFQRRRLNTKHVSDRIVTNRQRAIFQQGLLPDRLNIGRRVEGEPGRRTTQHSDPDYIDFIARSRAMIGSDMPVNLHAIIKLEMKVFE